MYILSFTIPRKRNAWIYCVFHRDYVSDAVFLYKTVFLHAKTQKNGTTLPRTGTKFGLDVFWTRCKRTGLDKPPQWIRWRTEPARCSCKKHSAKFRTHGKSSSCQRRTYNSFVFCSVFYIYFSMDTIPVSSLCESV